MNTLLTNESLLTLVLVGLMTLLMLRRSRPSVTVVHEHHHYHTYRHCGAQQPDEGILPKRWI